MAPKLFVLLDTVQSFTEGLARQFEISLVHARQLMKSTNAAKVVIQLLGILQVPQDLADDPDQADLGVDDFPPGQVVHTELLVKLIEFLNILSELE